MRLDRAGAEAMPQAVQLHDVGEARPLPGPLHPQARAAPVPGGQAVVKEDKLARLVPRPDRGQQRRQLLEKSRPLVILVC
jgi:hypothetical protein